MRDYIGKMTATDNVLIVLNSTTILCIIIHVDGCYQDKSSREEMWKNINGY